MSDLVELLDEERPPGSGSTVHDVVGAWVAKVASEGAARTGARRSRFDFLVTDPLPMVREWVCEATGRSIGANPTWIRLIDPKRGTGLLAVLHAPLTLPDGLIEFDLVMVAQPGMLTRSVIRDLCCWATGAGACRVVARVPTGDTVLSDLLRRAGFAHEGTARDFFGEGAGASVWAMSMWRCRWLPPEPATTPPAATSPSTSRIQ